MGLAGIAPQKRWMPSQGYWLTRPLLRGGVTTIKGAEISERRLGGWIQHVLDLDSGGGSRQRLRGG